MIAQARKLIAVTWTRMASRLECAYADAVVDIPPTGGCSCRDIWLVNCGITGPLLPSLQDECDQGEQLMWSRDA